ncbi:MAG: ABC transporter permease [Rhodospirillaceae bacterium]
MLTFIGKRLGSMILTMILASFLVFLALEASPGDVAVRVLGPYSLEEQREIWLEENGYNRAFLVRYGDWLANAAVGDFGESIIYKAPVSDVLWRRLGNTAILGGVAMAIIIPLSIMLGVLAGMREGSRLDRTVSTGCILTTSVPEFASATLLVVLFVFWLGWLPGTSAMTDGFDPLALVMPVLVLVLYDVGYVARMTRASMAEVMQSAYIRTAVLKGLPFGIVIRRHALRNALIAPFTVIMLQVQWLLSGVIVTEFFFSYKGFGTLILDAALNMDVYLIEACVLVSVFLVVTAQTIADIGYTYLNPRIRFA